MGSRMRLTRSKTDSRRAHHSISETRLSKDAETGEFHPRHRVSPVTGRYRGRAVIDVAAKLAKKEEKRKKREVEARRAGETVKERDEPEPEASEEPKASN